jgi:hypothetical protein
MTLHDHNCRFTLVYTLRHSHLSKENTTDTRTQTHSFMHNGMGEGEKKKQGEGEGGTEKYFSTIQQLIKQNGKRIKEKKNYIYIYIYIYI